MIENKPQNIALLPGQKQFIFSKAKEVLYSGAWRAGKSRVLCYALVKQVIKNPNNTVLLCRRTLESLRGTTLNTLLRGDNNDPVLPLGSYTWNKMEKYIQLNGGGRINYRGIDDVLKIRSMSLGAIGIDESIEFELEEYQELMGRLSLASGTRQIFMATNPGVPGCWMHDRFLKEPHPNREVILSRTVDNFFLPPDYIEGLKELPETMYRRFALGEWVALENMIYSGFNRNKHLRHREYGEFVSYLLGVDFGFTNPCAIGLFGVDGDKNIHLIEEQKQSKLLIGEISERCQKYSSLKPVVIVDPSAPALIAELEKDGMNVIKADNSVPSGIARMQDYLHRGKFSAEPNCYEFIKEIENYVYDKKGDPVKVDDHEIDLTRYCLNYLVEESLNSKTFCLTLDEDEP
jgi:phage terminase large subunit